MIIAIDGNEANIENRVGVNQYASELLSALEKLPEAQEHEWVIFLNNAPLPHLPQPRKGWTYKILFKGGVLQKTKNLWSAHPRPDVFFAPTHYLPLFSRVPMVMSIMDLGYLRFPDQFTKKDLYQLKYWTEWSLRLAKKVIAISESTKTDIGKHYPWAKKKTVVTLLGYDSKKYHPHVATEEVSKVKKKFSITKDYVLYVGTLKPSKNVDGLLRAWNILSQQNPDLDLVIAGKKGWLFDKTFGLVKELGVEKSVIFTDFVTEDEKVALMSGAKVLVSPAFWEGFGMHLLESMALGTPVIAGKVGSVPEVVGDAGTLVDPKNTKELAEAIREVVSAPTNKYNNLKLKSTKQAAKFSWEETARQTLRVLESAK